LDHVLNQLNNFH